MNEKELEIKIKGCVAATETIRGLIEKGLYKLYHEDGTEVKPEEYFWDESQFPIEVKIDDKFVEVNKQEIIDYLNESKNE